jgi:hypothetical protein
LYHCVFFHHARAAVSFAGARSAKAFSFLVAKARKWRKREKDQRKGPSAGSDPKATPILYSFRAFALSRQMSEG